MRTIVFILTFIFYTSLLWGQTPDKQVNLDTVIYCSRPCKDCHVITDTVIYKRLQCGLYLSSRGDIAYRTEEIYNDNFDRRTTYATWIYGADPNDTSSSGIKEMKYVIDTASFRFISDLYWADTNNIYDFIPTSDGGTISRNDNIDRATFVVVDDAGYAKDRIHVYYRGIIIQGADLATFKTIQHETTPELAYDKNYFYQMGKRMTDHEVKEFGLDTYKK